MKALALLFLLPQIAVGAEKFPRKMREGQFAQVVYFDLATITHGFFQSQLKVKFSEKLKSPESVSISTDRSIDDLGVERENTFAVIHGSPLWDQTVEVSEIDENGNTIRSLAGDSYAVKDITVLPPQKYEFAPMPLVKLSARLIGVSAKITDATGKRFLLTIDTSMQPAFYADPDKKEILQIADPAVEAQASFAFLPEGQDFSSGPGFQIHEQAVPEAEAKYAHCREPGAVAEVSPLEFGPGLRSERIEYCYTTGKDSFERIVLIRKNPPHEPKENAQRTLEVAKNQGGRLALSPAVKLPVVSYANCHGYALLSILGPHALPESAYWLQAQDPTAYSLGTEPLSVILNAKFKQVFSAKTSYYNDQAEKRLAKDSRLHEGDLLVFSGSRGKAHSAVVKKSPDGKSLWVENKFEEGPVIFMPIASAHDLIANLYDQILVYRKK